MSDGELLSSGEGCAPCQFPWLSRRCRYQAWRAHAQGSWLHQEGEKVTRRAPSCFLCTARWFLRHSGST
jgi:hypothetical protein